MRRAASALLALALFAACEPAGSDNIIEIDASGTVLGTIFVDGNASGSFETSDPPATDLAVALVVAGTQDTVARTRTNEVGAFSFPLVPVGRYEVVVPASALADSMSLVFRDPPGLPVAEIGADDTVAVTVGVDDSATVRLGVAYPVVTVEAARLLPAGRRVFIRAVSVAGVGSAADSTIFLEGETRGIAVRRVVAPVEAGDSVLAFGTTARRDGQPILTDASATVLASDIAYDTVPVFAYQAANADGGVLDARLVGLTQLIVTDTSRTTQRFLITAEDPTGSVEISIPITRIQDEYVPGLEFDVTGVLVPRTGVTGAWQIRPRVVEDIVPR